MLPITRPTLFFVSVLASALVSSGCATLFSETSDTVTIDSEPAGADVYWRGDLIGRTPFTHVFKRQTAASYLEFAKKGYETRKVDLVRKVAGATWLNLGFTALSPSSVGTDVSSGQMWEYGPKAYVAKLSPQGRDETWNERVMEYVIANDAPLKKDLARGSGETMKAFCSLIKKTPEKCQTFTTRVKQERALETENALEFYRALRAVDIEIKEDYR
ncbi:MAG: PEGA domain-containing protein [Bdellovibrionota bacterium]